MKWIVDNWSLLVVVLSVVVIIILYAKTFVKMPSEAQIKKVREWLLYAVVMAEKELGGGTGQIKLRYVYNLFAERFPSLVPIITFELFSALVDEALEKMRHLLDTNLDIKAYVEGQ